METPEWVGTYARTLVQAHLNGDTATVNQYWRDMMRHLDPDAAYELIKAACEDNPEAHGAEHDVARAIRHYLQWAKPAA